MTRGLRPRNDSTFHSSPQILPLLLCHPRTAQRPRPKVFLLFYLPPPATCPQASAARIVRNSKEPTPGATNKHAVPGSGASPTQRVATQRIGTQPVTAKRSGTASLAGSPHAAGRDAREVPAEVVVALGEDLELRGEVGDAAGAAGAGKRGEGVVAAESGVGVGR